MNGKKKKQCPYKMEGEVCELAFRGDCCVSVVSSRSVCPARNCLPADFYEECKAAHKNKQNAKAVHFAELALVKIAHGGQARARVIHENPYRSY